MRNRTVQLLLILACLASHWVATAAELDPVRTRYQFTAEKAKGSHLRPQLIALFDLFNAERFEEANQGAKKLQRNYEAIFDRNLKQYSFQSHAEFREFSAKAGEKFEWIDWGYQECFRMQAFIAAERKDYANALKILRAVEEIAPVAGATAIETGFVLLQLHKPDEALAVYRRAYAQSEKYESQRQYRAASLRGMGVALIDLGRLDEAERIFRDSLAIEPGNKVALHELEYIRHLRSQR